ncbi:MAG: hypothetical protein JO099_19705 [Acidobacteriia bacterium]|nr:hypothetical protein [Terriglobia bacterium]
MRLRILWIVAALTLGLTVAICNAQPFSECNESDAKPAVSNSDLAIVRRARQILSSPKKWNRADTRECPANEKTFSLYCSLAKATEEMTGDFEHRGPAMQEARFAIEDYSPKAKNYDHRLMDFNNDSATTFRDIQKVFALLQIRIANRLKEDPVQAKAEQARLAQVCANVEIQVVRRVREILSAPSQWDRDSSQTCSPAAERFGLYCAFAKAATELEGSFDGGGAAMNEARNLINETAPNHSRYQARLVDYNNDPTVTLADIQRLLERVEERLVERAGANKAP